MGKNHVAGFGADDGADIGFQGIGAADAQFGHGAAQHGEQAVRGVFLDQQQAQGGASLTGGIEGGGEDVGDGLFGQGGGIHHHGVLAAGFGDQRDRHFARVKAGGELALDGAGDLG